MYLETSTKFYELFRKQSHVYIHYGKISGGEKQLPFGTFLLNKFSKIDDAKVFYAKQLEEKRKKGYKIERVIQTKDMVWMRKNANPKVKTIR